MAKLTKAQIFEAIAAIQANWDKPTSRLLLDYFGSGSYSTFTKYLREYEIENEERKETNSKLTEE